MTHLKELKIIMQTLLKWENNYMHLYWRVIEELKYLGETWTINDPSLLRRYKEWTLKNAECLAFNFQNTQSEPNAIFNYKGILFSLN
jgi:hypothetical protein